MIRYVRIPRFCELTGYTEDAVRKMIEGGKWERGKQYEVAPDGHAHIDMKGFEEWAEQPLFQKAERKAPRQSLKTAEVVVYFIQHGKDGPIKIGRSTRGRVRKRISSLQIGSPKKLEVLHIADASPPDEAILHKKFGQHRLSGEWFFAADEVLAFVERCKKIGLEAALKQ